MIVKIHNSGTSFSGTAAYLAHDPNAQTNERVDWTHTRNLANDHVPSAVDEMLWTARDAELLKQQAGVRAGGRATENTVKHVSLNWSPDDSPTREHMIETAEGFLRHMKWQEHQAVLFSHTDKSYAHVHVMLNMVHPETGLRLDDDFERRRAQAWALQYEREQGRIHCGQRLNDPAEREQAPPRNIWMAFQENEREFGRAENVLEINGSISAENQKMPRDAEWQVLKHFQQVERKGFFRQGKLEFSELRNSIYREVRGEFRDRWAAFYAAERAGDDPESLAERKAALLSEQKTLLDTLRTEACAELREARDMRYRGLLDDQRDARATLRERQGAGLDNAPFLKDLGDRLRGEGDVRAGFRDAARQVTSSAGQSPITKDRSEEVEPMGRERDSDSGSRIGHGLGGGLMNFADALFFDLINLGSTPQPKPRLTDDSGRNLVEVAAEEATKQKEHSRREEEDEEWRRKQRTPYRE